MKSPIRYLGGKSKLVNKIVPLIPRDHICSCEPFCGASWILFGKEPSQVEIVNDLNGELVTFWRVIQNHLEEFLRYYKFCIVSRKIYDFEKRKDPEIRKLFEDFKIKRVSTKYSCGDSRLAAATGSASRKELLIHNM